MPRFSIIIPCFNAEATIGQTLDSLLAQSFTDFEIICIDDDSRDATRHLILAARSRDARIRLAQNRGKGPSDARNYGAMILAKGDIIAFCDADDLWDATKLAKLDTVFHDTATDAAFSRVAFFQNTPEDTKTRSQLPPKRLEISHLLGENPVCTMSNMTVRRAAFVQTGGFDPDVVHNEDLEWLIRLVGQGARVEGLDEVLTYYRLNPQGLSADLHAMSQGRLAALKTAVQFGHQACKKDEAIQLRYLARRALRLGHRRCEAVQFALRGVLSSPVGFFAPPRRGALTLFGALAAMVLPARVNHLLFSR